MGLQILWKVPFFVFSPMSFRQPKSAIDVHPYIPRILKIFMPLLLSIPVSLSISLYYCVSLPSWNFLCLSVSLSLCPDRMCQPEINYCVHDRMYRPSHTHIYTNTHTYYTQTLGNIPNTLITAPPCSSKPYTVFRRRPELGGGGGGTVVGFSLQGGSV